MTRQINKLAKLIPKLKKGITPLPKTPKHLEELITELRKSPPLATNKTDQYQSMIQTLQSYKIPGMSRDKVTAAIEYIKKAGKVLDTNLLLTDRMEKSQKTITEEKIIQVQNEIDLLNEFLINTYPNQASAEH